MCPGFDSLPDLLDHGFDTVIDVRSPSEYAEDHVPGAVNMPVLDDAQRAEVGTIYTRKSPFLARKIGAAMAYRNAATHVEERLMDRDGAWRPLVCCWRGGMRSECFAQMLRQVGWRAETLDGGYRSYRRLVSRALYEESPGPRVVLLDGNTGTAKTEILLRLADRGLQAIDLEGAARHRGSLLGATGVGQPSQKGFESSIATALAGMDPGLPLVLEAESSKIGSCGIPPALWSAMTRAPRIEIEAPRPERVAYLLRAYQDVLADAADLKQKLMPLKAIRGASTIERWFGMIDAGDLRGLVASLVEDHYDPAYATSRRRRGGTPVVRLVAESLDPAGLDQLAERVGEALYQLPSDTSGGPSESLPISAAS